MAYHDHVANAQYFGQNKVQYRQYDWRSIQSDHFEVYFYPGSDSLAMRALDLAEKTNAVFSRRLGHTLSKRIPIILYGSHNDFSQTNVTPELIEGSTGGFTEVLRPDRKDVRLPARRRGARPALCGEGIDRRLSAAGRDAGL